MKILAVDSSAKSASVAITEDDRLISESFVNVGLTHSETLMPMIESSLNNAKLNINDIDAFCVTTGPGSFTGIRIGVSAIKGLAQPDKKPCAGVSTLEAMAYNLTDFNGIVCCAMDARCSQVYTAIFEISNKSIKRLTEDMAIPIDELFGMLSMYDSDIILVGDGAQLCYDSFAQKLPSCSLACGMLRFQRAYGAVLSSLSQDDVYKSPEILAPVYIRPPQAERELKKKKENLK
ncbi:MAG: tRNA (adenosine(37)-N6)-threonylcarbamoyltransferase complex dimerization subunit type 1 TsaB [Clostridia bacterium]|nr:tRNA (adenosine(37)-N6)-threonylcarbamoyltransferase complex dimerization subunit type 1 TsaB [Clostridia bacterium]